MTFTSSAYSNVFTFYMVFLHDMLLNFYTGDCCQQTHDNIFHNCLTFLQCVLWCVLSIHYQLEMTCHIVDTWMVSVEYGFFHSHSANFKMEMKYKTDDYYMASLQNEDFSALFFMLIPGEPHLSLHLKHMVWPLHKTNRGWSYTTLLVILYRPITPHLVVSIGIQCPFPAQFDWISLLLVELRI